MARSKAFALKNCWSTMRDFKKFQEVKAILLHILTDLYEHDIVEERFNELQLDAIKRTHKILPASRQQIWNRWSVFLSCCTVIEAVRFSVYSFFIITIWNESFRMT